MDTQNPVDRHPEPVAQAPILLAAPNTELLAPSAAREVSDDDFEEVVRGALEAVGGTLLFKMKVGADSDAHHAAAAAVGLGEGRQFLLLTLPTHGGQLKVETTSHSSSPLARIAESYAGLMDVLKAAA
ncbi:hypothetical protein [Mesorhizobium sp. KR9-304]|uniref:hypothetical protein n=1 Tax=Mesorhizobium sp. KR9-304 TaxID=3156614 RepID=UPI0032B490C7